jgi:hypothetical protein
MRAALACFATSGLLFTASSAFAAEAKVDYVKQVKPILARCYSCHGGLEQKAKLRVDTAAALRAGGKRGPALVPGKPGESPILDYLTASNGARRMPPPSDGEALHDHEVALIRSWIEQGAVAPADEKPEADPKEHWAFRTSVRPGVPKVKNTARVINPIDAFLAAGHEKHGLTPQVAADRRTLLRRVTIDLTGLPPTREELAAFVPDGSADAYEKVVDRLLSSKQYGERWGRHWMDVWRYSDPWGLGAEMRNSQKHIWHWRDWIIESLNADKGYDQMVREMLAADELYPDDLNRLRASGFLARQYFKFNRNTWLEETVEHTSKAFLGLTMNCAKCHDHKYDPIKQTDYYRLRAFFEPYQVRTDQLPGEADHEKDGVPRAFDCNLETPTYLFVRGDDKQPVKDQPLAPGVPRLLALGEMEIRPVSLPATAYLPGLRAHVLENHLRAAETKIEAARLELAKAKKTLAEIEQTVKQTPPREPAAPEKAPTVEAGKPLLRDNFATTKPELWETPTGKWKHDAGKLVQSEVGNTRATLRAKVAPPADFEARFQFAITGGQMWRSVGVTFDSVGDNEALVYLSAFAGGPKLQVSYKQAGNYVYPPEGAQARDVKLNKPHDMTIRVRGTLVNVAIDGKHALAYRLPVPRKNGKLELITFDAAAEFLTFELSSLPATTTLVEAGGRGKSPSIPAKPTTIAEAQAVAALAERMLAAAGAQPAALRARAAADRAKFQTPPAADALARAREAAVAERRIAVAEAEVALARVELEVVRADAAKKAEADKKILAARTVLEQARKALDAPGEAFTSLPGSYKTLESNVESEASRGKPFPKTSTGRRTALANWVTDPRHPLTARVAANHIWARHFGKPLAPTVFDLGRKGGAPTHPELLDFLACELRDHHWSMKHLHRLIVTSNAYRMSSSSAERGTRNAERGNATDGENHYLWRMNPVRMEAEVVRDSLLSLGGELDRTMGGAPVGLMNEETSKRRSLYFLHSHNDHHRFLVMFDGASVLECYRRAESIVPQQALALSNSKMALTSADKIAARLNTQLGAVTDAAFVRAAFETVLATAPTDAECAECEQAVVRLTEIGKKAGRADATLRARAALVHALLNHNDFITVR